MLHLWTIRGMIFLKDKPNNHNDRKKSNHVKSKFREDSICWIKNVVGFYCWSQTQPNSIDLSPSWEFSSSMTTRNSWLLETSEVTTNPPSSTANYCLGKCWWASSSPLWRAHRKWQMPLALPVRCSVVEQFHALEHLGEKTGREFFVSQPHN